MTLPISEYNLKILNITIKLSKYMNYIEKFRLPLKIAQYIDFRLIFNDIYIDDPKIASDIKLNLYILYYLESYPLSQSFVIKYRLEIFYEEFYGWRYIKFSRLDKYRRQVFKKSFMIKDIYIDRSGSYIN